MVFQMDESKSEKRLSCLSFLPALKHHLIGRNLNHKATKILIVIIGALFLSCYYSEYAYCQEDNGADDSLKAVTSEQVVKVKEGIYKVGEAIVDLNNQEVIFGGKVNMENGLIEVFACSQGGKLHESVLVCDIEPYHLQVALLLLGLQYSNQSLLGSDGELVPDYTGSRVNIFVHWQEHDTLKEARAEDWIYNIKDQRAMDHTTWVFRGSQIINSTFVAQQVKSLITTYFDPATILDNPLPTGMDDTYYIANTEAVPPKDTPVQIVIRRSSNE